MCSMRVGRLISSLRCGGAIVKWLAVQSSVLSPAVMLKSSPSSHRGLRNVLAEMRALRDPRGRCSTLTLHWRETGQISEVLTNCVVVVHFEDRATGSRGPVSPSHSSWFPLFERCC